jgi:hypothetical protein
MGQQRDLNLEISFVVIAIGYCNDLKHKYDVEQIRQPITNVFELESAVKQTYH